MRKILSNLIETLLAKYMLVEVCLYKFWYVESCVRGFVKERKDCCFAISKFLRKAMVVIDLRQTIPLQYMAESHQIMSLAPRGSVKRCPLGSNRAL